MSVVVVSLNDVHLARALKERFSTHCRNYIQDNGEFVRLVTSVALLVDMPVLRKGQVELRLSAELTKGGAIILSAKTADKSHTLRVSPDSVFAYRYARVCWREPDGDNISLRTDDPKYPVCPKEHAPLPPIDWTWERVENHKGTPQAHQDKPMPSGASGMGQVSKSSSP